MSWVFLTESLVFKLKKPIRQDGLDFTTPERRRRNCEEEMRLNRRLAPEVYLGVVPLTEDASGQLSLGGAGRAIDWLVQMRRLPAADNLEEVMRRGACRDREAAIRRAAAHLAQFYADARPERIAGTAYRDRLEAGVRSDLAALVAPRYQLARARVELLAEAQLRFLADSPRLFEARAEGGHIVDGHGDLRPEHIWIGDPPAVIDCVEFDATLRAIDAADDLAFLDLECMRLGHGAVGRWFLEAYSAATADVPPPALLQFYRVYRALRRAVIAARHLDDPAVSDPGRFLGRARQYLDVVAPVSSQSAG